MTVHEDCIRDVRQVCPVWKISLRKMQFEKLQALFPSLNYNLIEEVLQSSLTMEVAIGSLMEEEKRKTVSLEQKQKVIDARPKRALTWTELRQIDRSIKEFTTRLEEIDGQASAISDQRKEGGLSRDSSNLETITEEIECVENALAALHTRRDQLIKKLKKAGMMTYFPQAPATGAAGSPSASLEDIAAASASAPTPPPLSPPPTRSFTTTPHRKGKTSPPSQKDSAPVDQTGIAAPSMSAAVTSLDVRSPSASPSLSRAHPVAFSSSSSTGNTSSTSSTTTARNNTQRLPSTLRRKSTPVTEVIQARALTVQGKLGTVHPDNQTSEIDLRKGPQVHPFQAVRQQEKLDEEITQRKHTIQDLSEKMHKLKLQLADDIKQVNESCLDPLKKPLRELYFMERALLDARIDYEDAAVDSLQKRIEYIRKGLDSLSNAEHSVSASFLLGSRTYLASDPVLSVKRLLIPVKRDFFFFSNSNFCLFSPAFRKEGERKVKRAGSGQEAGESPVLDWGAADEIARLAFPTHQSYRRQLSLSDPRRGC